MRVWFIPYAYLDSRRLVSQHNECHGLTTVILKGGKWGSIADQFKHSLHFLEEVHERCVVELGKRAERAGRTQGPHTTAYPEYPGIRRSRDFRPTREQLTRDVQQLREKWEGEGYHFGVGRIDLRQAERQVNLPEGRSWAECLAAKKVTNAFVRDHKEELKAMGTNLRLREKLSKLGYKLP